LLPLNLFCQLQRVRTGLVRVYEGIGSRHIGRALLAGLALGAVTPGRVGELGQVMFLPSGGRKKALGVMTIMRAYGFLSIVVLGLIAWIVEPSLLRTSGTIAVCVAVSGLVVLAALSGAAEWYFARSDHPTTSRLLRRIAGAQDALAGVSVITVLDRVWFVIWSLALFLVYLIQLECIMWAFGATVPLFDGLLAGAVTTGIVAVVPIAVGNIGVRETAAIVVWKQVGVSAATAFNGAFLLFVFNVVLPGLVGLAWNWVESARAARR
jgi:uncharacterized membrane protein YbhN (UPF0104 family)